MPAPASHEQWTQLRADIGRLVARRLPTRTDVDDVVQEVLLRVWRHGDHLRDGERFGAWLVRVAHTATADHLRSRQRHPLARFAAHEDATTPSVEDDPTAKNLIATALRPFIHGLPEPYREALLLAELEGLPYPVLAKRLGVSISGVKSRVQRGRRLLREALERCCAIALDVRGTPVACELKVDGVAPPDCCPGTARSGCSPERSEPSNQRHGERTVPPRRP
jgi:RNA polymerase sigma-70 factor (ECF subfamily)